MPETIIFASEQTKSGSPVPPADPSKPIAQPSQAPIIGQTTVSEKDAIGASGHTAIPTISGLGSIPGTTGTSGSSVSVGGMVDSKFAVNMLDALLPSLMVFLMYKIGIKMRKADLQLTEKEKDTISGPLQACLNQLMINFNNPWSNLALAVTVIYGSKIVEKGLPQILDKKNATAEKEALMEREQTNKPVTAPTYDVGPSAPASASTIESSGPQWEPDELLIKRYMNEKKYSRKKSIQVLKSLHSKGRLVL